MKIRQGFVSNSSSSSFMIYTEHLTAPQLYKILNHDYKDQGKDLENEGWSTEVKGTKLIGFVSQDNYDMGAFLRKIGIPEKVIHWSEWSFDFDSYAEESAIDYSPNTVFCPSCGCKFKIEVYNENT